jgi:hypothetical protein
MSRTAVAAMTQNAGFIGLKGRAAAYPTGMRLSSGICARTPTFRFIDNRWFARDAPEKSRPAVNLGV